MRTPTPHHTHRTAPRHLAHTIRHYVVLTGVLFLLCSCSKLVKRKRFALRGASRKGERAGSDDADAGAASATDTDTGVSRISACFAADESVKEAFAFAAKVCASVCDICSLVRGVRGV